VPTLPNPQSPIPNPQSPFLIYIYFIIFHSNNIIKKITIKNV